MKIKLCRPLNKRYLRDLASLAIIAIISGIIFTEDIAMPLALIAITAVVRIFRYPSSFEIKEGQIFLREMQKIRQPTFTFVIRKGYCKYKRAIVSIGKITEIEYISAHIPKFFDIGHIKISGEIITRKRNGDLLCDVGISSTYTIYGINNFKSVSAQIAEAFPNANHITQENN